MNFINNVDDLAREEIIDRYIVSLSGMDKNSLVVLDFFMYGNTLVAKNQYKYANMSLAEIHSNIGRKMIYTIVKINKFRSGRRITD